MKSRQMSGRMREMIQQMRAKNNPQAERLGAGLEEDLGQLSANLSNAKAQFVAEQKQEMSGELRRAMRDMIGLSQRQEALANSVRARPNIDSAEPAEDQFALLQGPARGRALGGFSAAHDEPVARTQHDSGLRAQQHGRGGATSGSARSAQRARTAATGHALCQRNGRSASRKLEQSV